MIKQTFCACGSLDSPFLEEKKIITSRNFSVFEAGSCLLFNHYGLRHLLAPSLRWVFVLTFKCFFSSTLCSFLHGEKRSCSCMKACSAETVASPSGWRWKELQLSQTESISVHPSQQTVTERKWGQRGGGKKPKPKKAQHTKTNPPTTGRGGSRVEQNKVSGTRKGRAKTKIDCSITFNSHSKACEDRHCLCCEAWGRNEKTLAQVHV